MLDIKIIRENPEKIQQAAADKNVDIDIKELLILDQKRRELITQVEAMKVEQKKAERDEAARIKGELKKIEGTAKKTNQEFQALMRLVPNPAQDDVPVSPDESGNKVLRTYGEKPKFDFKPKDHLVLGEKADIIDTRRATKVSGARFTFLKGLAVQLENALVRYAFDLLQKENFTPVNPPVMVKEKAMAGMGYVERGGDEIFQTMRDNFYLVGTAEQALGPMHEDEILDADKLPLRYFAYTPCFRREAGSYGKDTKGILRLHQFNKIEMFSFTKPEDSDEEHNFLLSLQEKLMQGLELHYQVVDICTGDLGDPAARKYDIETWIPSQNKFRETHSTSNCTDFQARRLKIRYKKDEKNEFVHTLNGTAFAIGRILIAIIEQNQKADGSFDIPKVLKKYI